MSNPVRTPKFQIGNIVYLVTGGPSMSVAELISNYDSAYSFSGNYKCQWFAGKKLENGVFPEDSLTLINPKP